MVFLVLKLNCVWLNWLLCVCSCWLVLLMVVCVCI